ncbi:MAG: choice-of-anchor tandem repeat NxxGxxAF-containing protein, partial [Thermoguttaceae bacterium]
PIAPVIAGDGEVAFRVQVPPVDSRILTGRGGELTLDDYRTVASTAGEFSSVRSDPTMNELGTVAFAAGRDSGGSAIYVNSGGANVPLADSTGPFYYFRDEVAISDAGAVAFMAVTDIGPEGIFVGSGGETSLQDYTTIADTSGPFDDEWRFRLYSMNADGTVAFRARVADGFALLTGNGGETALGDYTILGHTAAAMVQRSPAAINDAGATAFVARIESQDGLFTGPDPVGDRVIGVGDPLFGSTVESIDVGSSALNNAGQITFIATLADGTTGIYRADPLSTTEIVGRHVFYNNSKWDGHAGSEAGDPAANEFDDAAIATDKTALLPGETATFANYTSYSRGLGGIMVDIAGATHPGNLSAADFLFKVGDGSDPDGWSDAPDPLPIAVREGAGVDGSDRVTIRWEDNAIENQWLQVTVKVTEKTGLARPDVFYFGNAPGEAGDQPINTIVNATDEIVARNFQHSAVDPALIDDPYDYNRDGLVDGTDQIIARGSQTNPLTMLRLIAAPAVVEKAVEQVSDDRQTAAASLDWLYEFERISGSKRSSRKDTQIERTVAMLLATRG